LEAADGLAKKIDAAWLFAFYGPVLTPDQRDILRLYLEEDLSLSEIAGVQGITRQGVHEALRRAGERLEALEAALGLAERFNQTQTGLRAALDALNKGDTDTAAGLIAGMIRLGEEDGDGL
jgi:predicted DNA-binding protein YlxM (UPF0122 family)